MKPIVSLRQALSDRSYFGGQLDGPSWANWRPLLYAILGEELSYEEIARFKSLTGRPTAPARPPREFAGVIGRRGGKSRALGVLAAYLASCVDHRYTLAPGERGVVPVLAATKEQAVSAFNFICGSLESSRALCGLIRNKTADTLSLSTGVDIMVRPASYRSIRGVNAVAAIADECAFWRNDESLNPDVEIIRALRPSLLNSKGPLIAISSPYARRGYLWDTYRKHYGKDDSRVLVAQASSETMNPGVDKEWIAEQFAEDPVSAEAEFNANFRNDAEAYIDREVVEEAVISGRRELAPESGRHYYGFVDPSGGSGKDSFTAAVGHKDGVIFVVDAIRETKPPMSPEEVCGEYAAFFKSYKVHRITGDNFADEWPKERFRAWGITYEKCETPKSGLYRDMLPVLNSGRLELLDHPRLINQLCSLERRTGGTGRDIIDHPRGGNFHDDLPNVVAGVVSVLASKKQPWNISDATVERLRQPLTGYNQPNGGGQMKAFF